MNASKSYGPLPDGTHRSILAQSIAERAEVSSEEVDVDKVIDRLNALYVYEVDKLRAATAVHNYNLQKHENDFFDAEQLAYLAYPSLNFLTSDKGFNKAAASSQFMRIHIASKESLTDHAKAAALIGRILTSAK